MTTGPRLAVLAAVAATIGACVVPAASADVTTSYSPFYRALVVTGDGDRDGIAIGCPGEFVEVNGTVPSSAGERPQCSELRSLIVIGGGGHDRLVNRSSFDRAQFQALPQLIFYGGDGNDRVSLFFGDIPMVLDGGRGRDLFQGGRGGDRFFGTDSGKWLKSSKGDVLGRSLPGGMGPDQFTGDCNDAIRARDADATDSLPRTKDFQADRGDRLFGLWCGAFGSRDVRLPRASSIAAGGVLDASFSSTRFRASRAPSSLILPPQAPPPSSATPLCSDGSDNDGDGKVDHSNDQGISPDPDCSSPSDNSEAGSTVAQCSDGVDNDGDGRIDFSPNPSSDVGPDPDCSSPDDNSEAAGAAELSAASATFRPVASATVGSILRFQIAGPASRLDIRVLRVRSGISGRPNLPPCRRRTGARLRRLRAALARRIPARIQGSARRRRIRRGLSRRRCDFLSRVGTVRLAGPRQGQGEASFTGRVGGRRLRPGRYLAVIRTIDPGGKPSAPVFASFKIVR